MCLICHYLFHALACIVLNAYMLLLFFGVFFMVQSVRITLFTSLTFVVIYIYTQNQIKSRCIRMVLTFYRTVCYTASNSTLEKNTQKIMFSKYYRVCRIIYTPVNKTNIHNKLDRIESFKIGQLG